MQTVLLPKGLIQDLERLSRKFLWGEKERRKLHLVAWDTITKNKDGGGLGVKDLRKHNEAFIMKLIWNMIFNREVL